LKKACPIVKGYVFSNKWKLSDLYSNFCFLWEFEGNLHSCQKVIVQQ
jgi:hypothetical protein